MPAKIVNVASVPMRSPLRYPGGKTWLVPRWREFLDEVTNRRGGVRPARVIEPFAGGAILGLTAVMEDRCDELVLVELDPQVAAVWSQIINRDAEALVERILNFQISREAVIAELAKAARSTLDKAWQTILRNRCNRGGILAPGASLIKNGEGGKGISSRWYPETLAKRMRDIAEHSNRIHFARGDAFETIAANAGDADAVWVVDPPYTIGRKSAGSRLYSQSEIDHDRLMRELTQVAGSVMITYPRAAEVERAAELHGYDIRYARMKNTHHRQQEELLLVRVAT